MKVALTLALSGFLAASMAAAQERDTVPLRPDNNFVRAQVFDFADQRSERAIPGSSGASFCTLTRVGIRSSRGQCLVFFAEDAGEWRHQTGGDGADNVCSSLCVWLRVPAARQAGGRDLQTAVTELQNRTEELEDEIGEQRRQIRALLRRLEEQGRARPNGRSQRSFEE